MTKKEAFKEFVKKNPNFALNVKDGKTTWQELFEIYDLYGEESSLFDKYKNRNKNNFNLDTSLGVKEIVKGLKNINIDSLQESLDGLGKAVNFIEDLTSVLKRKDKDEEKTKKKKGDLEPINRIFDD